MLTFQCDNKLNILLNVDKSNNRLSFVKYSKIFDGANDAHYLYLGVAYRLYIG